MKTRLYHFVSYLIIPLLLFSILAPAAPAFAQSAASPNVAGMAHVKVAHFAPFANTVNGTAVVVTVDTVPVGVFKFGDITPAYTDLPAGIHHVEVAYAGGGGVPIITDITLAADTYYTISMIGNGTLQPLELLQQVDDTVAPLAGAKVRFTHLAPIAAVINDTKVDICTSENVVLPGLGGIAYKSFNDPYLTLPAGDYKLKIAQAGTSCAVVLIDVPAIRLSNGQILDAFAIGDVVDLPLALASTTGITFTPPAHVKMGHFAPFAATVDGTSVTVEVDGVPMLTGFKFGDMTPLYVDVAPEVDHLFKIFKTGELTPVITQTVKFTGGLYYTVAIIGDVTNHPLELDILEDDNTRPLSGARVRLADFAIVPGLTVVDICTVNNKLLVSNFGYKGVTNPYLEIPAGVYQLKIAFPGSFCLITIPGVTIPPITIIDFTVISAFAIGDVSIPPTVQLRWDQPPILSFLPILLK